MREKFSSDKSIIDDVFDCYFCWPIGQVMDNLTYWRNLIGKSVALCIPDLIFIG